MKLPEYTDVVVIGGGVIGTSVAYHVAKTGLAVCLVEARGLADGTSSSCDGGVLTQTKKPGIHLELALESISYIRKLAPTLPLDVEYHQGGAIVVARSENELPALEKVMSFHNVGDIDIEWWSKQRLREFEPTFSDLAIAATYCADDGSINPYLLTLAFASGAEMLGCQIITWNPVRDFIFDGETVTGVRTKHGEIRAGWIVLAAGVFSPKLANKLGVYLPVVPARGQIVVTESAPSLAIGMIIGADYLLKKHSSIDTSSPVELEDPNQWVDDPPGGFTLEYVLSGNLLIGSTKEFVGFDTRVTPNGIRSIVSRAVSILPFLEHLNCIRTYAGLRPQTPDGLPIIGIPENVKGLYLVTGHGGDGIMLAAITGKLVAEELKYQSHSDFLAPFSPSRFQNPVTGPLLEQKSSDPHAD